MGPSSEAQTWSAFFIKGYNFHTLEYGEGKSSMNSGVWVRGSNYEDGTNDFYGLLEEILQLEFPDQRGKHVVLFKCKWFDDKEGTKVDPKYQLVDVTHKHMHKKYEPFVLAQQADQVYYVQYPKLQKNEVDWMAVCKIKAGTMAAQCRDIDVPFQSEEAEAPPVVSIRTETPPLNDPNEVWVPRPQVQPVLGSKSSDSDDFEDEDSYEDYESEDEDSIACYSTDKDQTNQYDEGNDDYST